jgi:hypothetical protein
MTELSLYVTGLCGTATHGPKNKSFQFVHCWLKVRNCQKFLTVENNKRPRSRRSSEEGSEEEDDNSSKSVTQNSDESQPNPKKRLWSTR